jgi:hypothetical protein
MEPRRRTRSRAADASVVRLGVNGGKMKPGMHASLYM